MPFHPRRAGVLLSTLVLAVALAGCGTRDGSTQGAPVDPAVAQFLRDVRVVERGDHVLVLDTAKGMIAIELRAAKAPLTVQAIEALVAKKFYDGLGFHRVEKKFLVQTGDPSAGGGEATDAPRVPLEVNADLTNGLRGAVGMARPEDDRNGATSEFYILLAPKPALDGAYAVFGQVVKGMEVADAIEQGDAIRRATVVTGIAAAEAPKR